MSRAADNLSPTAVIYLRVDGLLSRTLTSFFTWAEYDSAAHRRPHALRLHRAASGSFVFSLVKCGDGVCALMLEVIRNHD